MFTGIVTDLGRVRAVLAADGSDGDRRFEFATGYDTAELTVGASVACSGVCLTAIDRGPGWFAAEASAETLAHSTLGGWREGTPVNFERPLTLARELGGHLVAGHVDGVARVVERREEGGSARFLFAAPRALAKYIAPKGSVALDGVSLTVNEVAGARFGVNIIAHTLACTTFGSLGTGDMVNLEVDMIARYVARLMKKD